MANFNRLLGNNPKDQCLDGVHCPRTSASGLGFIPPIFQAVALLNQPAPVQNQYYTILNTINARIIFVSGRVDTTGETLEARVTIDGQSDTYSWAAVAGSNYWIYNSSDPTGWGILASAAGVLTTFVSGGGHLDCQSFLAELRKTTAAGAGNLRGAVLYELL